MSQIISLYRQFKQQNLLQSFKYTPPLPSSLLPSPSSSLHLLRSKQYNPEENNNNNNNNKKNTANNHHNSYSNNNQLNNEEEAEGDLFIDQEEVQQSHAKRAFNEIELIPDMSDLLNKEPAVLNPSRAILGEVYNDMVDRLIRQIIQDAQACDEEGTGQY